MSEYKDQHYVIIDGVELTPIQSNFVMEAIGNQFNEAYDDITHSDVDEDEKDALAPAVLSLAEVLKKTFHPDYPFPIFIEFNEDKACFTGKMKEYNPPTKDSMEGAVTDAEISVMRALHATVDPED